MVQGTSKNRAAENFRSVKYTNKKSGSTNTACSLNAKLTPKNNLICSFTDDVSGSVLTFQVYLSDVFTHHTHADQLNAGDKANDAGHASPAADSIPPQYGEQRPDNAGKADGSHQHAKGSDDPQRLD